MFGLSENELAFLVASLKAGFAIGGSIFIVAYIDGISATLGLICTRIFNLFAVNKVPVITVTHEEIENWNKEIEKKTDAFYARVTCLGIDFMDSNTKDVIVTFESLNDAKAWYREQVIKCGYGRYYWRQS